MLPETAIITPMTHNQKTVAIIGIVAATPFVLLLAAALIQVLLVKT